jgi:hypothetical protein
MKIQEYTLIIYGAIYYISIINYSIKLELIELIKDLEENS